jgi:hypothetical protein
MEASRSIMQAANIKKKLQAEIATNLCYLQNITPNKGCHKKYSFRNLV